MLGADLGDGWHALLLKSDYEASTLIEVVLQGLGRAAHGLSGEQKGVETGSEGIC